MKRTQRYPAAVVLLTISFCVSWTSASASETAPAKEKPIDAIIADYCTAVSDQAGEQRLALQMKALRDVQAKVESRLGEGTRVRVLMPAAQPASDVGVPSKSKN